MSQEDDLKRYLLGDLDEATMRQLDRRALGDDGFAQRLAMAEDTLIDAHVRGDLDPRHAEQVAARLAASAAGRERLAFAHTLFEHVRRADETASTVRQERARPRPRRAVLAWAAAITLALGGWWLLGRSPDPGDEIPAFVLVAAVRATGETPRFTLPPEARTLRLDIDLEGVVGRAEQARSRFRVTLRDGEGAVLVERTGLRIEDSSGAPAIGVTLDVAPGLFGLLSLTLERRAGDRPHEILGVYRFEITRGTPTLP